MDALPGILRPAQLLRSAGGVAGVVAWPSLEWKMLMTMSASSTSCRLMTD